MPTSLGPAEILVILVVALIVLGPKRLPEAARQVGKALAEVRKWSQGIQDEVRNAMDIDSGPPTYPSPPPPPPSPEPTQPTPIPILPAETAVPPEVAAGNGHPPASRADEDQAPADQTATQQLDLPGEAGPPADPPRN